MIITAVEKIKGLLESEEILITSEVGDVLGEVKKLLRKDKSDEAIERLEWLLDQEEIFVSTEVGDEIVGLIFELS